MPPQEWELLEAGSLRGCHTSGGSAVLEAADFCGFCLQEPHHVLMVEAGEDLALVGEGKIVIVKYARILSITKVPSPRKKAVSEFLKHYPRWETWIPPTQAPLSSFVSYPRRKRKHRQEGSGLQG